MMELLIGLQDLAWWQEGLLLWALAAVYGILRAFILPWQWYGAFWLFMIAIGGLVVVIGDCLAAIGWVWQYGPDYCRRGLCFVSDGGKAVLSMVLGLLVILALFLYGIARNITRPSAWGDLSAAVKSFIHYQFLQYKERRQQRQELVPQ